MRALAGPYTNRDLHIGVRGVYSNTTPIEPYRGASRPEALLVLERLVDNGARALGIDASEIRLRNFILPDQFPYITATGARYDSADLPGLTAKLKTLARYDELCAERDAARARGIRMGIGLANFIDLGGGASQRSSAAVGRRSGSFEVGTVRVHPSGKVTILAGTQNHGQGHETSFCQIVADRLGCPIDDIELASGDTDLVPFGLGTWGSRSLPMAGVALAIAADKVVTKCRQLAAHLLECTVTDLARDDGDFLVAGTDRRLGFGEVARAAYHGSTFPDDFSLGLDETVFYEPPDRTYSSAIHLAVVFVDAALGHVTLRDYVAVDDSGRLVNPMIVEGQLHGAITQGIGQAVMEACTYDPESGQLLTGSFMDYGIPRASDLPLFRTGFQETLAPDNLLGVKGAGESGSIGAPVAIANAVVNALADLGIRHLDMPLTADRVWAAIDAASSAR